MFSLEEKLTFEQLPEAVAMLLKEVNELKSLISNRSVKNQETDKWLNLEELSKYIPDHPARQTVYGWIGQRLIPYHKKGKRLQFLKSEIDSWLMDGRRKTAAEMRAEAENYVNSKRGGAR